MTIFLCLLLTILVTLIFSRKIKKPSKWKLPPGPKKLPIIGNLHNLKGMPHACFRDLSRRYGPVILLHMGLVPTVVISSKEGAEEALKIHDLECCSRPKTVPSKMVSYNFKDIGFAPYNEEWKALRKLVVMELFNTRKIQSFRYIREEENDLFVEKLSEYASKRSPVNLTKTLLTLAASIVCRIGFGQNLHHCKFIDEDGIADLLHSFDLITESPSFSDLFPGGIGWVIDRLSGQKKRLENVFLGLDTFFQKILDDHLKAERIVQEVPDILDVMIDKMKKHENDGDSFQLTTDHIKGIISNIFLAGVDSSANVLIWAMTELMRNPRVMKKVQEEIRTTLGNNKKRITEGDVNELHYFKLLVKETLRLHLPGPLLIPRETMSHVKIHGYDIPAKTQMMINAYAIARDPTLWTNPDEFNPDRFLGSSIDYRGLNFEFLPFGSGRRICPGMTLGIANIELGLLNMLYFFDWGLPEGMTVEDIDLEEKGSLVVSKKTTLELVPLLHHYQI